MQIIKKAISQLRPSPYNPRKDLTPDDPEYQKLKKSILEFDYVDPIIWNKKTDRVVGGHQRLKILKEIGRKQIDVSVVNLSDTKEKALNVALNKVQGEWDYPKLKDLLIELDTGAFDMELTGFDMEELEQLLTNPGPPPEAEAEESNTTKCPECGFEW